MAVRDAASLLVGLLLLFHTWGAWADVEVNMEDRVEVSRGKTTQIACMFNSSEGVGGMIIEWFYVMRSGEQQKIYYQDSTMNFVVRGTPLTDRISVNGTGATRMVVLTITDVRLKDELEFCCSIKSLTDGNGERCTNLKVFEKPDFPVIEAVETGIAEGSLSKIGTCEVKNGYPKPNITWYRNNTPLYASPLVKVVPSMTTESSGLISVKSELSMMVVKEDKDDQFYCAVNYFVPGATKMTETNRINITVYYLPTAVSIWVESPKGKIKEGDSVELHCRDNGNDPSSIISIEHADTEKHWEGEMVVLDNVTRDSSGVYHCISTETNNFGEIRGNTTVLVNYLDPAMVEPADTIVVAQGEELNASCNASSSLKTHAVWFKNGEEVSKGHDLTLNDATFDTAGTYVCVLTVPEIEGMETSAALVVNVQGPPKIMKPDNTEMEESFEKTVDLSCHVRGFPAPSITWTTSDGKVLKTASEKVTQKGIHSVASVKVTSDITVICNASNEYGADALTFNIKATTTTPTTTTPIINTSTSTTTSNTISSATVKAETAIPPKKIKKESSGVLIAVIIICILLLAILGSVLYFLYKKGKICGRSGKQDLTKEKSNKDNIVVEMKSDNTEEAVLLGVNGEKQPPSDQ